MHIYHLRQNQANIPNDVYFSLYGATTLMNNLFPLFQHQLVNDILDTSEILFLIQYRNTCLNHGEFLVYISDTENIDVSLLFYVC